MGVVKEKPLLGGNGRKESFVECIRLGPTPIKDFFSTPYLIPQFQWYKKVQLSFAIFQRA